MAKHKNGHGATATPSAPSFSRKVRDYSDVLAAFDALLPSPSWSKWRTFIKAIFGLEMDDAERQLYTTFTGRRDSPSRPCPMVAAICGRRSGKSRLCAFVATYLAAFRNYDDVLVPGETGTLMVMAASRDQAERVFKYVGAFLDSQPSLQRMVIRKTSDTIELSNHTAIRIVAASHRLSRGATAIGFVGDESAFWSVESSAATNDVEVMRAVSPSLLTTHGPMILISTPYSRTGVLFQTYDRHYGVENDPALVWMADTKSMNPTADTARIDADYLSDPESSASEYGRNGLIEFRQDLSSLISREALQRCLRAGPLELPVQPGDTAFVDVAGGQDEDYSLGIARRDLTGKSIVVFARMWSAPFKPVEVTEEVCKILNGFGIRKVIGDKSAVGWVEDAYRAFGITYETSTQNKSQIYLNAVSQINSESVELPDDPRLVHQLLSLQRRTGFAGRDQVDHPHNRKHRDDLANAVCGAAVFAVQSTGPLNLDGILTTCLKNSGLKEGQRKVCVLFAGPYVPSDPICRQCPGWQVAQPRWLAYQRAGGPLPLRLFVREQFTNKVMERNKAGQAIRECEGQLGL